MSKEYEDFIYPSFARRQKNKSIVLFEPILKERLLSLLQRNEPMKPTILFDFRGVNNIKDCNGVCKCGANVYKTTHKFCHKCGQALDWGAENE